MDVCEPSVNENGETLNDFDCGCSYSKISYGSGAVTKYFSNDLRALSTPQTGYCKENPSQNCECDFTTSGAAGECRDVDCPDSYAENNNGLCLIGDGNETQYRGWSGYCLESDESIAKNGDGDTNPCLTFYPLDVMEGLQNIYNNYDSAGFDASVEGFVNGGPFYCTSSAEGRNRKPVKAEVSFDRDCNGNENNYPILIKKKWFIGEDNETTKFTSNTVDNGETNYETFNKNTNLPADSTDDPPGYWALSGMGTTVNDYFPDFRWYLKTDDPIEAYNAITNMCTGVSGKRNSLIQTFVQLGICPKVYLTSITSIIRDV